MADRRVTGRRAEVLGVLREATAPLGISEIADAVGVHANTVRFHLDALLETGQVERATAQTHAPGRPPQVFRAVPRMDPGGPRHYRMLAEVLVATLGDAADRGAKAAAAGRAWGHRQAKEYASTNDGPVTDRLLALLDDVGFAPERCADVDGDPGVRIGLRSCPFLELAEGRPDVVCPVHQGLMEGAIEAWGSSATIDRLEPFVEPDLCRTHVTVPEGA